LTFNKCSGILDFMFTIQAKKRNGGANLDALRKEGEIPAVFYGAGRQSTSVSISSAEFKKVWRNAGESSAVKIKTLDGDVNALIHEVQLNPITDEPIHVDFLAIDMNKKIQVKVPLIFEGVSNAVKSGIGNLVKVLHEVEVEALPADLPHNLAVDVSSLEGLENQILVSDIKLPVGVKMITDSVEVVASIITQVEEKEEVAVPVDLSAIEVEKKGKKEEDEAETATPAAEDK
jgi:large subunit ribosomal protein L25